MLRKMLMVTLAVSALTSNTPAAFAAVTGGCSWNLVRTDRATGSHDGAVIAYAVDDTGGTVTIRCYVIVNDVPAGFATATGRGVAIATSSTSFEAADGAHFEFCSQINDDPPICADSAETQLPPQEVIDVVEMIAELTAGLHPILCGVAQTASGPALVNSTTPVTGISMDPDDCDVYLGGKRILDLVPLGD